MMRLQYQVYQSTNFICNRVNIDRSIYMPNLKPVRGFLLIIIFSLLYLSTILLCLGLVGSKIISSSGTIKYDIGGTVYWSTGFETGDFSEVATVNAWPDYGSYATVNTGPVYDGNYAVNLSITTPELCIYKSCKSELIQGSGINNHAEVYVGGAFYIPPGFTPKYWAVIAQLKVPMPQNEEIALLQVGSDGKLCFAEEVNAGGWRQLWKDIEVYTSNKWYTFVMHVVVDTEAKGGVLELWIDGEHKVTDYDDYHTNVEESGPNFQVDVYVDYYHPEDPEEPKWILFDQLVAGSTYGACANYLRR